jgi:hypothetical protein
MSILSEGVVGLYFPWEVLGKVGFRYGIGWGWLKKQTMINN